MNTAVTYNLNKFFSTSSIFYSASLTTNTWTYILNSNTGTWLAYGAVSQNVVNIATIVTASYYPCFNCT